MASVLALSGCTSAAQEGASPSDWTAAVGSRWDGFVDGVLAPLADTGLAILLSWLGLAVAARVLALIPPIRNLRMTRRTGWWLRLIGWVLVVVTPIITVVVTAFAPDALVAWLIATSVLAFCAMATLAPGLATRSRLDAKVIAPDGSTNEAWSIDALLQVRNVNLDDPRKRVERPSSPDLGDFITIADRSGNGIASVVAWLLQVLFNSAPWMLQVTILDGRSAIATLRRNGLSLGEVELKLERGAVEADQHRKLLALAAAFTAMTMAERYPDVRGFYGAKNWTSVGYLGLAQLSEGEERAHYVNRAVELEPRSLLAEYERVFSRSDTSKDRQSLENLMDRLEPIVNQSAWVCGRELVFECAEPRDWHDYPGAMKREGEQGEQGEQEQQGEQEEQGEQQEIGENLGDRPGLVQGGDREPCQMLLRTLLLYTFAARNWAALLELEQLDGDDDEVRQRRERIRNAVGQLVIALDEQSRKQLRLTRPERFELWLRARVRQPAEALERRKGEVRERKDSSGVLVRMRARTALCFVIFSDGPDASELIAAADPAEPPKATHAPGAGDSADSTEIVRMWLKELKSSVEIEIRYSYACYLARQAGPVRDDDRRKMLVKEAIRRVRTARHVDLYRDMAAWDPELKLLGDEPDLRDLVLTPIASPWEIERFARMRPALNSHGVIDPTGIAVDDDLGRLLESTGLGADEFALLIDGSSILRLAETTTEGGLDGVQRLRAARYLIDDAAFSVRSLLLTFSREFDALAAAVAGAVFWVPTDDELKQVQRFLAGLAARLDAERAAGTSPVADHAAPSNPVPGIVAVSRV